MTTRRIATLEVSAGAVENAVLEAYRVGKAGGRIAKVRLEARAVTFTWEEPARKASWLGRKLAAALRRAAAILDSGEDRGGQHVDQHQD